MPLRIFDLLHLLHESEAGSGDSAPRLDDITLFGVVVAVRPKGGLHFADLRDPTGLLQLAAEQSRFEMRDWQQLRKRLAVGARCYVTGHLARSRTGTPTLWLARPPQTAESVFDQTLARAPADMRRVGTRLFTSRIRRHIERFLDTQSFLRLDANMLSVRWPDDGHGLAPLEVAYPGFGGLPAYLAPSPAPQLLEALIATGEERVYASTVSYTTSYRGPLTGVEAIIVCARTFNLTRDELAILATDCLRVLAADLQWTDPELQIFRDECESTTPGADLSTFRLMTPNGIPIAEGGVEGGGKTLPLGSLSFYPDRLLPLLASVPIRRLQDLWWQDGAS